MTGAVCGATWAAGLRGWMVQLATASSFSWLGTFGLVLLPGTVVGGLLGWAAHLQWTGGRAPGWLVWSPVLFALAILDPANFVALVGSGMGGGALGVIGFGLAGGCALAGQGRRWLRILLGAVAGAGVAVMGAMNLERFPADTARGAWVALYGASLLAVFCLACALPQGLRQDRGGARASDSGDGVGLSTTC